MTFKQSLYDAETGHFGGYLHLRGYVHPLPAGLTSVGGYLDLRGYVHPLPAGLTSVGGYLYLSGYVHPLPAGLTSVGGYLDLSGYAHPLPAAFFLGGRESRGYTFWMARAERRVRAGCRNYTLAEARAHWGPGGPSDRPDCLALVERIAAEIEKDSSS